MGGRRNVDHVRAGGDGRKELEEKSRFGDIAELHKGANSTRGDVTQMPRFGSTLGDPYRNPMILALLKSSNEPTRRAATSPTDCELFFC